mmetsp:Transcript_48361/g.155499  ORF Transcript_48361/g.155499 Transcript_48361/m.155499 type:complete len:211 (+) Transcript_48361:2218-2850(+)
MSTRCSSDPQRTSTAASGDGSAPPRRTTVSAAAASTATATRPAQAARAAGPPAIGERLSDSVLRPVMRRRARMAAAKCGRRRRETNLSSAVVRRKKQTPYHPLSDMPDTASRATQRSESPSGDATVSPPSWTDRLSDRPPAAADPFPVHGGTEARAEAEALAAAAAQSSNMVATDAASRPSGPIANQRASEMYDHQRRNVAAPRTSCRSE